MSEKDLETWLLDTDGKKLRLQTVVDSEDPNNGWDFVRKALQQFFFPYNYEHVNILHPDSETEYVDMFVIENSANLEMPVNEEATRLYQRNAIIHQGANPEEMAKVYGPAIYFGEKVWK